MKPTNWEPEIELGSLVEDVVSGFRGVAVACARHIHLCDRYTVQPRIGSDGKQPEPAWIDGHALRVIDPPSEELKKSISSMKERIEKKATQAKVGCAMSKGKMSI
jgi:hypothetical protein